MGAVGRHQVADRRVMVSMLVTRWRVLVAMLVSRWRETVAVLFTRVEYS